MGAEGFGIGFHDMRYGSPGTSFIMSCGGSGLSRDNSRTSRPALRGLSGSTVCHVDFSPPNIVALCFGDRTSRVAPRWRISRSFTRRPGLSCGSWPSPRNPTLGSATPPLVPAPVIDFQASRSEWSSRQFSFVGGSAEAEHESVNRRASASELSDLLSGVRGSSSERTYDARPWPRSSTSPES